MKKLAFVLFAVPFAGCVRQADLDSWVGVPVAMLDKHPFFLTVPVVRTKAEDGTEIRNYVNGGAVTSCSGGGSVYGGYVSMATYNAFTSCSTGMRACNNIFFIKDGKVTQYTPIGSGGTRCFTDDSVRPGYVPRGF